MSAVRVFVGCAANHEDAESQAVLEWSLRKHSSMDIEIVWMMLSKNPDSFWFSDGKQGWQTRTWATPFSCFRWAVPAYCGFEGRAIYMDSDVIVQADIADLWNQKLEKGKGVLAKGGGSWRFCVSLWDCEKMKPEMLPINILRSDPISHRVMMDRMRFSSSVQQFEGAWNCLDGETFINLFDPDLKAIHYTVMSQQPHLRYAIPRLEAQGRKHWFNGQVRTHWRSDLIELFDNLLEEAEREGFGVDRYTGSPLFGEYVKQNLSGYKSGPRSS
jgi:hypothetical protein